MLTNEQFLFYGFFVTAFGLVLVWGALLKRFFKRLEQAHPQEYAAMRRPSVFWRNSPSVSVSLVKFLVRREHRALNDSYLSKSSNAMLVVLVVYFLLFIALGGLIIGLGADRLTIGAGHGGRLTSYVTC